MNKNRHWLAVALNHAALIAIALLMAWPFIWGFLSAIKTSDELWRIPPTLWPASPQWQNFVTAWTAAPFTRYFLNSVFVALSIVVLQTVIGAFAAYGFTVLRFRGRDFLFQLILASNMLPVVVTYVPSYLILAKLHWLDTYQGLIISNAISAFGIFLLRQAFLQFPKELTEAARMDGAGHGWILWRLMVPLSKPTFVTLAMLTFVAQYNNYLWPLLITKSPAKQMITVGLTHFFITDGAYGIKWPLVMAANFVAIVPLLVLFAVGQRWYVQGIARSGLKG